MNNYNNSQFNIKNSLKQGLVYLLIALPFVVVVAVVLTIIEAPVWLVMICNIVVGGSVVLISYIVHNARKKKIDEQEILEAPKYDPFKD